MKEQSKTQEVFKNAMREVTGTAIWGAVAIGCFAATPFLVPTDSAVILGYEIMDDVVAVAGLMVATGALGEVGRGAERSIEGFKKLFSSVSKKSAVPAPQ